MRLRRAAEPAIVVFAAIVIACIFTYPYISNFSNGGRIDTNDGRWSIWVVSWVAHALTTDPASIFSANIFYPHDNALAFSEGNFIGGAIAVPAWLATRNPYATHNFFFIATFVLSSVATYYLIRHLTGDWRAAAITAVLYAYSPFAFARQAHSQLLMIGVLPWAMLSFHRFLDRVTMARAIELGVVLWIAGLACAYYGIFAGGMVATGTIMFGVTRGYWKQPRYWLLVAAAAAVCIALTAPLFLPYLRMQETTGFARPLAASYSANISAWLISSAWAHRWWAPWVANASEVLFPGIIATIFGIWGACLWRGKDVAWFYVTIALLAFWTTFGPKAGLYTVFYHTIPVFSFLRAPSRTGIVVTLCLVVLAAPALIRVMNGTARPDVRLRAARPGRSSVLFGVLFMLAIADTYRAPLRMREAPPLPDVYRTLARLPRGPVIELPFWSERNAYHRHAEYMLDSAYHWQPLINGYSDHIPQDFRDYARPLSGFPSKDSFALLEPLGARYAVIHLDLVDPSLRESLIERLDRQYVNYLRPIEKDGEVWLYEIIGFPR